MAWFRCLDHGKVISVNQGSERKCPSCGGTRGEFFPDEKVNEGQDTGVFYNIEPRTGKPAKPRRGG